MTEREIGILCNIIADNAVPYMIEQGMIEPWATPDDIAGALSECHRRAMPLDLLTMAKNSNSDKAMFGSVLHDLAGIWFKMDIDKYDFIDHWVPRFGREVAA